MWPGLNQDVAPFDNPNIRRAIQHAIDRETVVDAAYCGAASGSKGIVAPGLSGNRDAVTYDYEPAKARALLEQEGATDLTVRLDILNLSERLTAAQVIQAMRALRGLRIATDFLDPMGALNPVISVGRQMVNSQYRTSLSSTQKEERAVEMLEPALLIAGEPTTALDATLEVATIEMLKDLHEKIGCFVLFISHHLWVIAELCDDVVVMYAGEVIERGTTRQVFNDPRHPYTSQLLEGDPACQSQITRTQPTIPGEIPDLRRRPEGCILANRCHLRFDVCDTRPLDRDTGDRLLVRCHAAAPSGAAGAAR